MKINRNLNLLFALGLAAGGVASSASSARAAAFTYTPGDLLLSFRESGQPDLVVDIGQASTYDAVTAGSTISVLTSPTSLSTLLNTAYPSLDGLSWTVTGAERPPSVNFPLQTLWLSSPRSDTGTQAVPWSTQSQFAQGGAGSQISAIGGNANSYSSLHPGSATNNATAVVIPNSDPNAYSPLIGDPFNKPYGDLGGNFGGNVENTTPFDFDSGEPLSISDLYELQPAPLHTTGTGKWVGYFSFTPDGNVTFTAATVMVKPPAPTITSVSRTGNVTKVSFTTATNFTYGLAVTNLAGLRSPRSTWPATGTTITGNGSVLSLQDTNSTSASVYIVTIH